MLSNIFLKIYPNFYDHTLYKYNIFKNGLININHSKYLFMLGINKIKCI